MAIVKTASAIKPAAGIRPVIGRKPTVPAAAPTAADEAIEQAQQEEQLAEETGAEETTEAAAPAPAAKPAAVKPAAVKPAADKPAADKPAADKPAAAPATKEGGKKIQTLGATKPKFQVSLPDELGAHITQDNVHELFHQFFNARAEQTGMHLDTKVKAVQIFNSVFEFLFGGVSDAPIEGTVESIVANGGLALLFEVKPMEGVRFKHTFIENRRYRNPRTTGAKDAYVRVMGRRTVSMDLQVEAGETVYEAE
jgi:hypothetical protein